MLKNIKIKTKLLHLRHKMFCKLYTLSTLVIYTFRYSLAIRAFPKAKYSVVCTKFTMVSKFSFPNEKFSFPYSFQ